MSDEEKEEKSVVGEANWQVPVVGCQEYSNDLLSSEEAVSFQSS
jgi:hypothetical protein